MKLVQLLLPARDSEGKLLPSTVSTDTRAELIAKFGGLTAYLRTPASGVWADEEGRVERDEVVMVEVVVGTFDRAWWNAYARRIADRFDQKQMHIRVIPVELL